MSVGGLDPCEGEGWAPTHTSDASRALRPWLLRRCASVTAHARKSLTDWAARRLHGENKNDNIAATQVTTTVCLKVCLADVGPVCK